VRDSQEKRQGIDDRDDRLSARFHEKNKSGHDLYCKGGEAPNTPEIGPVPGLRSSLARHVVLTPGNEKFTVPQETETDVVSANETCESARFVMAF
jgi:hypothetical protein